MSWQIQKHYDQTYHAPVILTWRELSFQIMAGLSKKNEVYQAIPRRLIALGENPEPQFHVSTDRKG